MMHKYINSLALTTCGASSENLQRYMNVRHGIMNSWLDIPFFKSAAGQESFRNRSTQIWNELETGTDFKLKHVTEWDFLCL